TAAPDLDLRLAELRRCLRLVQPLKRSVMTFIEAPRTMHGNPHQVHDIERNPERANRSLQHGGVGDVEREAACEEGAPGRGRLGPPLLGQVNIGPAGEAVLAVPVALTVSQKNKFVHPGALLIALAGLCCGLIYSSPRGRRVNQGPGAVAPSQRGPGRSVARARTPAMVADRAAVPPRPLPSERTGGCAESDAGRRSALPVVRESRRGRDGAGRSQPSPSCAGSRPPACPLRRTQHGKPRHSPEGRSVRCRQAGQPERLQTGGRKWLSRSEPTTACALTATAALR